jgi:hypothetical protein
MASLLKSYGLDDKIKEYRTVRNLQSSEGMSVSTQPTSDIIEDAQNILMEKVGCSCLPQNASLVDLNTMTMTARVELFVDEENWKTLWPVSFKRLLFSLITYIESQLRISTLRTWNLQRSLKPTTDYKISMMNFLHKNNQENKLTVV